MERGSEIVKEEVKKEEKRREKREKSSGKEKKDVETWRRNCGKEGNKWKKKENRSGIVKRKCKRKRGSRKIKKTMEN